MATFHLVTERPIHCPAIGCERTAAVCTILPPHSFFYNCTEHAMISSRAECLALAECLIASVGLRFEIVKNDPYDMHHGKQTIPGFSYWAQFYLPSGTVPVFQIELWAARDARDPDALDALAAMGYNPYSTDEDDYNETSSPDEQAHFYEMQKRASAFVELWQGMLTAVQRFTGTAYQLEPFLMNTVRNWA